MVSAVPISKDSVMADFWAHCLTSFQKELPAQQFNAWIKSLRIEAEAPGRFRVPGTQSLCHAMGTRALFSAHRKPASSASRRTPPALPWPSTSGRPSPRPVGQWSLIATATAETTVAKEPAATVLLPLLRNSDPIYEKTRLNPDFTFEALVTGRSNDLARAAAQQVAMNPGVSYNPLFIYGGVGLGKTHLVHALGNEVWRQNPDNVVRYVHAHDYIADVVRAYQQKAFDSFKRYYCSLDLLIIDDIQFFNGKDRTQEEFFYAFNALIEAKKQIVITCDTYPKDIQGLEDRLISRFDCGLTVQIEPPELEMRVAILKKKAEVMAVPLGDDVAFLIAKNLRSNVRELEGALNRVIAFARFHRRDLNTRGRQGSLEGCHRRHITARSHWN